MIRIGREIQCLPYAGFLKYFFETFNPAQHAYLERPVGMLMTSTNYKLETIWTYGLLHTPIHISVEGSLD